MRLYYRLVCLYAALGVVAFAAQTNTATILTQARAQAAAEHKSVLLLFSASWCGPCHRFEAFLNDPKIKPIMDKAFVESILDVGEHAGDPRHHDTPGAVDLRASLGGGEAGYPYIVMLDATGRPIVTSLRPNHRSASNIGYPATAGEIEWFMQMLAKAAPSLTPDENKTIRKWLDAHSYR